jgi:4-hydroxy-2-oxoheptanedioate aldolase
MFRPNLLKVRLAKGEVTFGIVHAFGSASAAEMIGLAGFDYVLIDDEHGMGDMPMHLQCLQAVFATPATAMIRVAFNDPNIIKRALDLGAEGIMVPDIRNATQAKQVVAACRYPPGGVRGYAASGVRASDYGLQTSAYLREHQQRLLIAVILESEEAVANAEEICAVDGIDIVQVGANDLTYDLGIPEQLDHPRLHEAIAQIEKAAKRHGKTLGGAPLPHSDASTLVGRGYRLITLGRDVSLLSRALGTMSASIANLRSRAD